LQTPLCMAAEYGHVNVVRVLLSKGAQVNEMTPHGDLPLHIATEMVRYLFPRPRSMAYWSS
jgi:ankyrin repeat protein